MEFENLSKEERNWALFAHLSSLLGIIGIPLGNIIAPLIIWQIRKDDMPFAADCAKESLNFGITLIIYGLILFITVIGMPLLFILIPIGVIFPIIAGVKANEGKFYRYPWIVRFVK